MNAPKIIILSLIGGVLVTLLTGLISNMPTLLIGASHYGYPIPWLFRLVVAPEYFPWRVDMVALLVNVIIWTLIVGLALFVWSKTRTHQNEMQA